MASPPLPHPPFSPSSDPTVTVVIPLGPGDKDIVRTADILDAIRIHEPLVTDVILMDDDDTRTDLPQRFPSTPARRIHVLRPTHDPKSEPLYGGLTRSIFEMFAHALRHTTSPYILRFDTDAHIIAPFARRLHTERLRHEHATGQKTGVIGCIHTGPDNKPRPLQPWNYVHDILRKPLSPWLRSPRSGNLTPYFHVGLTPTRQIIRRRINQALSNGYQLGVTPMGGAYAVTRELLQQLDSMNALSEGYAWEFLKVPEDAVFAVYTYAAGFTMADSHRPAQNGTPGDIFAVLWQSLHTDPDSTVKQGYAIVHSVKRYNDLTEPQIRRRYAELRGSKMPLDFPSK
jgi:hypothetical protein